MASTILNRVSCLGAPNCTARHRYPCSSIDGTCGSCLPSYDGDLGDSNDPCVSVSDVTARRRFLQSSSSNKTCVSDCSGNGHCEYINANTNKTVSVCISGDVTCTPVCRCNANFYGVSCAVKYEDMVNKQGTTTTTTTTTTNANANTTTTIIATRVALLSSLKTVADKLDVDPLSAKAVLLSLSSLTQSPEELSPEAATIAGKTATTIIITATAITNTITTTITTTTTTTTNTNPR